MFDSQRFLLLLSNNNNNHHHHHMVLKLYFEKEFFWVQIIISKFLLELFCFTWDAKDYFQTTFINLCYKYNMVFSKTHLNSLNLQ